MKKITILVIAAVMILLLVLSFNSCKTLIEATLKVTNNSNHDYKVVLNGDTIVSNLGPGNTEERTISIGECWVEFRRLNDQVCCEYEFTASSSRTYKRACSD